MLLRINRHQLHLSSPLVTAHGTISVRDLVVVTAEDGGHHGSGEAAPLPGFGLETLEEARSQLASWADGGAFPTTPAAASAAHCALSQLHAAQEGTSLDGFLTGKPPATQPLAVQALVGASEPREVAVATAQAITAGHRAVKLKVAAGPAEQDIERVHAAHAELPAGGLLRLDANQGWTRTEAEGVLGSIAHLDVDLVEEPTADIEDFRPLAGCGTRVAADEHLTDPRAVEAVIKDCLVDALVLKPAVLGGPQAAFDLAQLAKARGQQCIVSSFIDGPVGLRAVRDLALAIDPDGVHGIGTATLFADSFPPDVTPRRGALHRESTT